jgi:uncharacterized protein YgiM (DUF1202 family)
MLACLHAPDGGSLLPRRHATARCCLAILLLACVSLPCQGASSPGSPVAVASHPRPAAPDANKPSAGEAAVAEPNRAFPYSGQITGNDVVVRSGPGMNFYQCSKLYQGKVVEVLGEQAGWSRISPPEDASCWVAMQYVAVNIVDSHSGIVTGDGVGAYAASDAVAPLHSTEKLALLRRGDKVSLLGQEKEGYLKIMPPRGSSLWVSSKYVQQTTRPAGATGSRPGQAQPALTASSGPVAEPTAEAQRLKDFAGLQDKFNAERAKPLAEQDYTAIKKSLTDLANDTNAGKAAQYARRLLEQVANCELAKQAAGELEQQDKLLKTAQDRIAKAHEKLVSENPDMGRFCVIGKLETSTIFSGGTQAKRFRVTDDAGKTVCYAEAVGAAAGTDMTGFVGQKVGLVGTIKPYPAISGALAEFTEIVKLP